MPFLENIDFMDVEALESLNSLNVSDERDFLREVLSHPNLREGITDSQRARISFLFLTVSSDPKYQFPEVLDSLLDPSKSRIEEQIVLLPLAGPIRLAVAHTRRGNFHSMGNLEHAMRRQEEFMLEPFPLKYVGVLAAEVTPAGGGGSYPGSMIAIDPGGEDDIHLVAHEVAHKYFLGNSPWLGEGGAEVLRAVAVGDPLRIENVELSLCQLAKNLSEIDRLESEPRPGEGADVFPYVTLDCPYVMGFGLFVDLYTNLEDWAFRQSFRRLHLKARDGAHKDVCVDKERAVCLVRQAFVTDAASVRDAEIAGAIIHRWYYGSIAEFRSRAR